MQNISRFGGPKLNSGFFSCLSHHGSASCAHSSGPAATSSSVSRQARSAASAASRPAHPGASSSSSVWRSPRPASHRPSEVRSASSPSGHSARGTHTHHGGPSTTSRSSSGHMLSRTCSSLRVASHAMPLMPRPRVATVLRRLPSADARAAGLKGTSALNRPDRRACEQQGAEQPTSLATLAEHGQPASEEERRSSAIPTDGGTGAGGACLGFVRAAAAAAVSPASAAKAW
eukprot:scaffold24896_cov110-Isochrysis_galbana.AAC.4